MKNQYTIIKIILLTFIFPGFSNTYAQLKLPALFSDNMVIQQESEAAIWGWAGSKATVTITPSWNNETYTAKANKAGEWKTNIPTPTAGGSFEIIVKAGNEIKLSNILIGEVWLCSGQSNMEMPMKGFRGQPVRYSNETILKSKNDNIRFISVPRSSKTEPQADFKGQWNAANPETVGNFSATAYYFGNLLQELLNVPVGLIDVSYGGSCIQAWMSKETSEAFEDKKVPQKGDSITVANRVPTVLFNGMLSPVIGYGIKGCIWYQGETNYQEPDKYPRLFNTMVEEWRSLWKVGDFPFYFAQVAPFDYAQFTPTGYNEKYNSAYIREAQLKASRMIPNCGMAVLMDTGEKNCIHPSDKEKAGHRLAYQALAKTYGIKGFGYESPVFKAIEIVGSTIVVSFDNVPNGLTSFGKELTGFEIAGENKRFYPAKAWLRSKSVVVSAPEVNKPVAVRYAFKDFVIGELFSTEGLPLSSFRSDKW